MELIYGMALFPKVHDCILGIFKSLNRIFLSNRESIFYFSLAKVQKEIIIATFQF